MVEELTLALKATEVEPVKEALAEAAIQNLSKHPAAKKAEAWLQDLKVRRSRGGTAGTHGLGKIVMAVHS